MHGIVCALTDSTIMNDRLIDRFNRKLRQIEMYWMEKCWKE